MTAEALGRVFGILLFPVIVMAIVGGVYYLAVRPRLTYRQAILRWWVVVIGLVALLLGVCGQVAQLS